MEMSASSRRGRRGEHAKGTPEVRPPSSSSHMLNWSKRRFGAEAFIVGNQCVGTQLTTHAKCEQAHAADSTQAQAGTKNGPSPRACEARCWGRGGRGGGACAASAALVRRLRPRQAFTPPCCRMAAHPLPDPLPLTSRFAAREGEGMVFLATPKPKVLSTARSSIANADRASRRGEYTLPAGFISRQCNAILLSIYCFTYTRMKHMCSPACYAGDHMLHSRVCCLRA